MYNLEICSHRSLPLPPPLAQYGMQKQQQRKIFHQELFETALDNVHKSTEKRVRVRPPQKKQGEAVSASGVSTKVHAATAASSAPALAAYYFFKLFSQ